MIECPERVDTSTFRGFRNSPEAKNSPNTRRKIMMGTRTKVLCLSVGLGLLAACTSPAPTMPDDSNAPRESEVQFARIDASNEVQALVAAQAAAWRAKDPDAFAATYTDDATFINPLGWVDNGRDAIHGSHAFLFGGPFAGTTEIQEITAIRPLTGTILIVHLDSELTGYAALLPGLIETRPGVVGTKKTWVVEKRRGKWEIVTQHMAPMVPAI
jgi:uncharacterized protein (TIGR02246 family)